MRRVPLWVLVLVLLGVGVGVGSMLHGRTEARPDPAAGLPIERAHLDHSAFFSTSFEDGPAVTRACLECHEEAAREVMGTAHFKWLGDEVVGRGTGERMSIGKRNLLNNFCIGIKGNEVSCTRCHAGYGWEDDSFDFTQESNVDCLVCHDRSGQYVKGDAGRPAEGVDLLASAKSVGFPTRSNCGTCHNYGGGGLGVKHGDLDSSLDFPDESDDVHMGRAGMQCIDCHGGDGHNIKGKAYSVSVRHDNGIGCAQCHTEAPHSETRLNEHVARVACQTCHIPTYARSIPTKTNWDWSKAGDGERKEDQHEYLKAKGEFVYGKDLVPEYYWFNLTMERYLAADPVAKDGPTAINRPGGDRRDPAARIWPFKVHRATQPYDAGKGYLIAPVTAGKGGYWHEFDWNKALELGAKRMGLDFSGKAGFVDTVMYWPLSHMVAPAREALQCLDCHGGGRMDWKALGYAADPMRVRGDR